MSKKEKAKKFSGHGSHCGCPACKVAKVSKPEKKLLYNQLTKNGDPRPTAEQIREAKALIAPVIGKKKKDEGIEGEVLENQGKDQFGRWTCITEDVKALLIEAFAFGCTNLEASRHAGIGERTLDRYFKKNPEFKEYCFELKENPTLTARSTLVKALNKSPFFALKYLERKKSDEFSIRIRQTFDEPLPLSPDEEKDIDDALDENV